MPGPPTPDPGPPRSPFRRFVTAVLARLRGRPAGPKPGRDRRRVPRLPVPPGVRATVHLEAPDEGTDVALGLIDVSEDGAGLRLRTPVRPGEETYLALYPPGGVDLVLVRRRAAVVWCRPESGSSFRAGVRFTSRLTPDDLHVLAN
jgi:PilZ domain